MRAATALQEFRSFLTTRGLSLDTLTPTQATDVMLQFYSQIRFEECDIEADDDMLLFQWGVYDWGEGEFFDYNITRQLIYPQSVSFSLNPFKRRAEEEILGQLSLTLKYEPTPELRAIEPSNQWCSNLQALPAFAALISECEATRWIQHQAIVSRELRYGNVE